MNDESRDAWAIKIGGSLYGCPELPKWLQAINDCINTRLIIIPGGGPFADQVRQADIKYNIDPDYAHQMAVLGMQQFGTLLASMCPTMANANSIEDIQATWSHSHIVIWQPYEMIKNECDLEKSWKVTSDSLAVWLASKLSLKNILLVKSCQQILQNMSVEELINSDCVDPAFKRLSAHYGLAPHILHRSQINIFKQLIN